MIKSLRNFWDRVTTRRKLQRKGLVVSRRRFDSEKFFSTLEGTPAPAVFTLVMTRGPKSPDGPISNRKKGNGNSGMRRSTASGTISSRFWAELRRLPPGQPTSASGSPERRRERRRSNTARRSPRRAIRPISPMRSRRSSPVIRERSTSISSGTNRGRTDSLGRATMKKATGFRSRMRPRRMPNSRKPPSWRQNPLPAR